MSDEGVGMIGSDRQKAYRPDHVRKSEEMVENKPPAVDYVLNRLEYELSNLNESMAALEKRLESIVMPVPEQVNGANAQMPPMCYLATRIENHVDRAKEINYRINRLMLGLEL